LFFAFVGAEKGQRIGASLHEGGKGKGKEGAPEMRPLPHLEHGARTSRLSFPEPERNGSSYQEGGQKTQISPTPASRPKKREKTSVSLRLLLYHQGRNRSFA